MNLITLKQWATEHGICRQRAHQLIQQNRVRGAVKVGSYWLIPKDATIKGPRA